MARPKNRMKNPKLYHAQQIRESINTTWQETAVSQQLHKNSINFVWQPPFLIHGRELIVDFLVKSPRGIPVAIECSTTSQRLSQLRRVADKLDNRFRLLKDYYAIGTIAVLTSESSSDFHIKEVLQEFQKTLAHTDLVIIEPEQIISAIVVTGEKVFKDLASKKVPMIESFSEDEMYSSSSFVVQKRSISDLQTFFNRSG